MRKFLGSTVLVTLLAMFAIACSSSTPKPVAAPQTTSVTHTYSFENVSPLFKAALGLDPVDKASGEDRSNWAIPTPTDEVKALTEQLSKDGFKFVQITNPKVYALIVREGSTAQETRYVYLSTRQVSVHLADKNGGVDSMPICAYAENAGEEITLEELRSFFEYASTYKEGVTPPNKEYSCP